MYDYPSSDDEDGISPELEAELYSKIHYGDSDIVPDHDILNTLEITENIKKSPNTPSSSPEITENVSLEVLNEMLNLKQNLIEDKSKCYKTKSESLNSGRNTPDIVSTKEDSKYGNSSKNSKCIELTIQSSDSEDDSGIQIISETKKEIKGAPLTPLLDIASTNSSDSEIEHLPCFKRPAESLVIGM